MKFGGQQDKFPPRQIASAGTHVVTCYGVIDLGTVKEKDFNGNTKAVHKTLLLLEFPNELVEQGDYAGQPVGESWELTLSFHEKANLRKVADAARGKPYTETEVAHGIDPRVLLGSSFAVTVEHKTAQTSGRIYAKLKLAGPLIKGMPKPKQVNPSKYFDLDRPDHSVYQGLPRWMQRKIADSPEAQLLGLLPAEGRPAPVMAGAGAGDEDNPF